MISTTNYIIKAVVNGSTFFFYYDETMDVFDTMEKFWHEDYQEALAGIQGGEVFPIDVYAMSENGGKVIAVYPFMFNAAVFHAYYDNGHKYDGPYTENDFLDDILRKDKTTNDVTSFFYYMWNRWSEEECHQVFKDGDYKHFWNKWCQAYDDMKGPRGAAELFYMMLSDSNRDKLVARALELYDGMSEKD